MKQKQSLVFKLTEYYNRHFEQKLAGSIFAVGGLGNGLMKGKMLSWIRGAGGNFLDAGSGDRKWEKCISERGRYLSMDYLPAAVSSPWREAFPHINADGARLPFKDNSFDTVINIFVLEHVPSPHDMIREFSRVLKPGGFLLLAGPGDILMSHGEPYNYFHMTKYAYKKLLEDNRLEITEEYFPYKSWMSIAILAYLKIVRHGFYNKHGIFRIFQAVVLLVSIFISPVINVLAWLLDLITPFDKRGYMAYMVRARKRE